MKRNGKMKRVAAGILAAVVLMTSSAAGAAPVMAHGHHSSSSYSRTCTRKNCKKNYTHYHNGVCYTSHAKTRSCH